MLKQGCSGRDKRPGEVHGKDYLFVSKQQFEQWIEEDKMLEHAVVYGEYKGIPKSQVDEALANGSDVVLRIDVQGAATVKRLIPESVHIFLVSKALRSSQTAQTYITFAIEHLNCSVHSLLYYDPL